MPKPTTKFVCQQCGFEAAKWMGRCTDCGAWNTMVETVIAPRPVAGTATAGPIIFIAPISAPDVAALAEDRRATGSPELDRTLGGGLMPGSLVLLGGEPGIGKSSLLLKIAGNIAEAGGVALYVCAEESPQQVKLRAERLGALHPRLFLLPATEIEAVTEQIEAMRPALVVVDSIQTVATSLI
ncbi:MAG TPA: ATPase domain-containing protein, partial [Ktedonobacterales bacterium]|nr:ATPase domain-containing protein [Ktedonobacterales bacterium]